MDEKFRELYVRFPRCACIKTRGAAKDIACFPFYETNDWRAINNPSGIHTLQVDRSLFMKEKKRRCFRRYTFAMGELFGSDRVGIYGGTVVVGATFYVTAAEISFINHHPNVKKAFGVDRLL